MVAIRDRRNEDREWSNGVPILGATGAPRRAVPAGPIVMRPKDATSAATFAYEHPDDDDDPFEDAHIGQDLALAKRVGEWKEREFPGHPFRFEVNSGQGIVTVSIPALMGEINCYVIHVTDLYADPSFRRLREACGNLLERYGISRAGYSRDDFAAAVSAKPVLFRRHEKVPD